MTDAPTNGSTNSATNSTDYASVDASFPVEADAVRMLPEDAAGVAVAISGDVLMVVTPRVPTPAEFADFERLSGMSVTVAVAVPGSYGALQERAAAALPTDAPRAVGPVLADAVAQNASDILLVAGDVPRMRVDGMMVPVGRYPTLSNLDLEAAGRWMLGADFSAGDSSERVVAHGEYSWRSALHSVGGNRALTARKMPRRVPRLEDLGVPSAVVELARGNGGLVLFAGASGSGKTTTCAALVDRINATQQAHIVTLEQPVEYRHVPRSAAVEQREVGTDVASYADGVRDAVRHGADVIVVAEIRDADTARAAVSAALAGHLVLATIAAPNAQSALHRLLTQFDTAEEIQARAQLAAALRAVVAQKLVPAIGGGRQLVCEVLLATDAVRALLRDGRIHELAATLDSQARAGMTSMDRSLAHYVAAGRVEEGVARQWCEHADRFTDHLHRAPGFANHHGDG